MIKTGTILGDRYEILEKIGTGGMAEVFKGKDHKLNRYVAVKVLKEEFRHCHGIPLSVRCSQSTERGIP